MIAYSDTLLLLCAEAPLLVHTAENKYHCMQSFLCSQLSLISHGVSQPSVHLVACWADEHLLSIKWWASSNRRASSIWNTAHRTLCSWCSSYGSSMVCFDTINSVLMGGVIDGLRSYTPCWSGRQLQPEQATPRSTVRNSLKPSADNVLNAIVLAMWFQTAPPEKGNTTQFLQKAKLLACCMHPLHDVSWFCMMQSQLQACQSAWAAQKAHSRWTYWQCLANRNWPCTSQLLCPKQPTCSELFSWDIKFLSQLSNHILILRSAVCNSCWGEWQLY